jgi:hypothetical protein
MQNALGSEGACSTTLAQLMSLTIFGLLCALGIATMITAGS